MKVLLIRRSLSKKNFKGVDAYSNSIVEFCKSSGIDIIEVPSTLDLGDGVVNFLVNGLMRPSMAILKNSKKYDLIHASDELCGVLLPLAFGRKKIVTIHHVVSDSDGDVKSVILWRIITGLAANVAETIVVPSQQTKKEVVDSFKIQEKRIVVVSNHISEKYVTLSMNKEKMITFVGHLIPRKNIRAAILAFKSFTEHTESDGFTMCICGDGPDKEMAKKIVSETGLVDKVSFVSNLSADDIVRLYNRSFAIINTSSHEGFGLTVLEIQRCSTPVICLNGTSIPEEVIRFAVLKDDCNGIAEELCRLVNDNNHYKKIVSAAKEYADSFNSRFDEQMKNLYCN